MTTHYENAVASSSSAFWISGAQGGFEDLRRHIPRCDGPLSFQAPPGMITAQMVSGYGDHPFYRSLREAGAQIQEVPEHQRMTWYATQDHVGPGLSLLINLGAAGLSLLTAGTSSVASALALGETMAGTFLQGAARAMVTSLYASIGVTGLEAGVGQQTLADKMQEHFSPEHLGQMCVGAVFSGGIAALGQAAGVAGSAPIDAKAPLADRLVSHIKHALPQAGLSGGVNTLRRTVHGEGFGDVLGDELRGLAGTIAATVGAREIGILSHAGKVNFLTSRLLHFGTGAVAGTASGHGALAGGIGAAVGETVAEIYRDGHPDATLGTEEFGALIEMGTLLAQAFAASTAMALGQDPTAAASSAATAVGNNCFLMCVEPQLDDDEHKKKPPRRATPPRIKDTAFEKTCEAVHETVDTVRHLPVIET